MDGKAELKNKYSKQKYKYKLKITIMRGYTEYNYSLKEGEMALPMELGNRGLSQSDLCFYQIAPGTL